MKVIDVHTHGIGGYDTRTTAPEDVLKVAEIHGSYGVSELLLAVYPGPVEKMRLHMDAIRRAMEAQRRTGAGPGASILGVHLEGPFLNPLCAGALDSWAFLKPRDYDYRALTEGFEDIVKIITISPELDGALPLIRAFREAGIAVSMGHSNATFSEAEAGFRHGARGITHLFNAMAGYHHREPGIAGFGLLNPDIYVELVADPFHLHHRTLELVFRVKDPTRIMIISDSVKETHCAAPGGAVSVPEGALTDAAGILKGGAVTVWEAAVRLIDEGFDPDTVLGSLSANPGRFLAT